MSHKIEVCKCDMKFRFFLIEQIWGCCYYNDDYNYYTPRDGPPHSSLINFDPSHLISSSFISSKNYDMYY